MHALLTISSTSRSPFTGPITSIQAERGPITASPSGHVTEQSVLLLCSIGYSEANEHY